MKTRSQKLISLVLVLMMLVTMVPMGIFSANAAVSAALAAGLADIDNTTEFVINSVEDWNAVAATDNQFLDKTVKLGADIDAQGAALPQLFMAGNARCTFDGQGYTIRNVGTAQAPMDHSLFSAKSNISFQDVTVQNVFVSGTGNKAIFVDWQNCWGTYTFKNIKVINCSVASSDGAAGALIGLATGNGGAGYGVEFDSVIITGTALTAANYVGALVGTTYFNSGDLGLVAKKVEVTNSTLTDNSAECGIGGLVGFMRGQYNVAFSAEDCYVNATFVAPNSSGWNGVATGFVYFQNSSIDYGTTLTLKNCISDCTYPGIMQSTTLFYTSQNTIVTENVFATADTGKAGMCANGTNTINGTANVPSDYNAIDDVIISKALLSYYITRDVNGFITAISTPTGLALDLQNYATTSTFVIKSADDWNTVAASGKNFSGKTVKLGANIGSANAVTTLDPLTEQFYGTFDGAGYTLTNILVNGAALISSGRFGTATVRNLKVDGLKVSGTGALATWLEMGGNCLFQNIKITGLDVQGTGTVGGLVGLVVAKRNETALPSIKFENISLTGSVKTTTANQAGGLVGELIARTPGVSFENVYTAVNVSVAYTGYGEAGPQSADEQGNAAAGGLIGWLHSDSSSEAVRSVLFENCVTAGTISSPSAPSGFIGYDHGAGINLVNCIAAHTSVITTSTGGWLWMGAVACDRSAVELNYTNLTVVSSSFGNGLLQDTSAGVTVNGVPFTTPVASGGNGDSASAINAACDDVLKVDAATAELMINTDANGFITMIDDHVHAFGYQKGTNAIRLIAKSQLTNVTAVTLTVVATTASGTTKQFVAACTLYDKLTAYNEYGVGEARLASDFDAAKLAALTIYNLPAENITFVVTTTYTTAKGLTVTGTNTMTVNYTA